VAASRDDFGFSPRLNGIVSGDSSSLTQSFQIPFCTLALAEMP